MRRRLLLAAAAALAGCSVLPERPAQPARRFALAPQRAAGLPAPAGGPVLLLRGLRAAPGLELTGLRQQRADGSLDIAPLDEWIAPPADLAEAALRRWLAAAGLFAAVVAPGSRAEPGLTLEAQLIALETVPAAREARAGLAGVVLRPAGQALRVAASFDVAGTAPFAPGAGAAAEAAALTAALGAAFLRLEAVLAGVLGSGRTA